MANNPPEETKYAKRLRLLAEARRAEQAINETLLEHSETEQEAHRRRVNENIEKFLPGVTEDEQNVSGMYQPDPKYFAKREYRSVATPSYKETHEPMRRALTQRASRVLEGPDKDPTLGGEVAPWSDEEEEEYSLKERRAENAGIVGTGEWAASLSPEEVEEHSGYSNPEQQELWRAGNLNPTRAASFYEVPTTRDIDGGRGARIDLFQGGMIPNIESSQHAPYEIDERNVAEWARKHRQEVAATGIEDTEWKQRFENLKKDVVNTIVPIQPNKSASQIEDGVESRTNRHLKNLDSIWTSPNYLNAKVGTTSSRGSGSRQGSGRRRGSRRVNGPVRRNLRGVANSFINQNERGATTGRGSMSHSPNARHAVGHNQGWLDTARLRDSHLPEVTDSDSLYSYNTPIAWKRNDGTIIVPTERHSKTTSSHQSALRHELHDSGYHSPQELANTMLLNAYRLDRHKQTAGRPVAFKNYLPEHSAHEYTKSEEGAYEAANQIADEHYEKVRYQQRINAEIAGRRPRNSRKPFTRAQQRRLEDAGQLRLPMSLNDEAANRLIMNYPITLGYSAQVRRDAD